MRLRIQLISFVLSSVAVMVIFQAGVLSSGKGAWSASQYWNDFNNQWINRDYYYEWVNPGFFRPVKEWRTPSEYFWPNLTFDEANALVGKSVRCAYRDDKSFRLCVTGEHGKVVGVAERGKGYGVFVHWESYPDDVVTMYGRSQVRRFLTFDP